MTKKVILLLIVVLLIFSTTTLALEEGILPDFELKDMAGNVVKVSDFFGQYVLFDVWATWCKPCCMALEAYVDNYDKFQDLDIKIVAISIDTNLKTIIKYVEEEQIPFTVLHDKKNLPNKYWGVRGIPAMFLVNPKGEIIMKHIGFGNFEMLWQDILTQIELDG